MLSTDNICFVLFFVLINRFIHHNENNTEKRYLTAVITCDFVSICSDPVEVTTSTIVGDTYCITIHRTCLTLSNSCYRMRVKMCNFNLLDRDLSHIEPLVNMVDILAFQYIELLCHQVVSIQRCSLHNN